MKNELFEFDTVFNKTIIGTDEAGRGPAAGGVFASAVCFYDKSESLINDLSILNDSKQLSKKKRESIYDLILNNTINSTINIEVKEIEKINILNASLKAMKLACENVIGKIEEHAHLCQYVLNDEQSEKNGNDQWKTPAKINILTLVDGNKLIRNYINPQKFIIKGDSKSASIAAASILAKVTRDRYMEELDKQYPQYGWAKNAGYLTKSHIEAIDKFGLSPHHRPSFLKKHFAKLEQISMF